jgi:hypothetical protein
VPSAESLRVGFARADVTPALGAPLSGVVSRRGRFADRVRDRLHARALHMRAGGVEATLCAVDLLLCTARLHEEVARRAGVARDSLLLSATHTHSGPGGYWDAGRGRLFMGPYDARAFGELAERIAHAVTEARRAHAPARLLGATGRVAGASANRRRLHGPTDPELTLLRVETHEGAIDLVSFSAHPVIGCIREPHTVSADWPGELCARIEARGRRALFFQGAVGGLSPIFPEFPMRYDEHLDLMTTLLERGVERAEAALAPVCATPLEVRVVAVPAEPRCNVFAAPGALWRLADAASWPLRRYLATMARQARDTPVAPLHLLRLGEAALLGTPCDLGVTVALALKRVLREAGVRLPAVGSQANAYVGYVHLPEDYARTPEPGFREMAYYENAMSLSGHDCGRRFVEAMRAALGAEAA